MIKVKELIETLQKCNPDAVVCLSEKWGRGGTFGNAPTPREGTLKELGYAWGPEDADLPAIELSCDF